MEQLDSGEEIPCSSNLDNAALWPDDSKTVDAPMLGSYPANQNEDSEQTDLISNRFILGLFIMNNLGETNTFIYGTIEFKTF